jgi:hypothetical protein
MKSYKILLTSKTMFNNISLDYSAHKLKKIIRKISLN